MRRWMRQMGLLSVMWAATALAGPTVDVQFDGIELGAGVVITTDGGGWFHSWKYSTAGLIDLVVDGEHTQAFCIDPYEQASYDVKPYVALSLPDALNATKAQKIADLLSHWDQVDTATKAAGLQLALWEVIVDDSYDLSDGSFRAMSFGHEAIVAQAATYLADDTATGRIADYLALVNTADTSTSHFKWRVRPGYQDYVIRVTPAVPVPASLALVLLGTAWVARRRV